MRALALCLILSLTDILLEPFLPWKKRAMSDPAVTLTDEERARLRTGDVLLQVGVGVVPDTILWALGESVGFSHAAVLVREGSQWFVIHAVHTLLSGRTSGVHTLAVEHLLQATRPSSLVVVRPNLTEDQRRRFLDALHEYLRRGTPFDDRYSWEDDTALYCSELVLKALIAAGMEGLADQLEFRGPVVAFANFLNPNFFSPVLSQRDDWPDPRPAHTR